MNIDELTAKRSEPKEKISDLREEWARYGETLTDLKIKAMVGKCYAWREEFDVQVYCRVLSAKDGQIDVVSFSIDKEMVRVVTDKRRFYDSEDWQEITSAQFAAAWRKALKRTNGFAKKMFAGRFYKAAKK